VARAGTIEEGDYVSCIANQGMLWMMDDTRAVKLEKGVAVLRDEACRNLGPALGTRAPFEEQ
jgi:hypothetical protein